MSESDEPTQAGRMANTIKLWRTRLGWSTKELAERARDEALKDGLNIKLSQQTISAFEQGDAKRIPSWAKHVWSALEMGETRQLSDLDLGDANRHSVLIESLPTYAGAGGGGTGEGDVVRVPFSRSLVEYELRALPKDLLAITIEGNSMDPDFMSGDQLLVDRRKTSLAQPGAFCLWDGDGYVVKYVEKIPGSEPPKVRVISRNTVYSTTDRLAEEVQILGRVVWFARRV